MVMKMKAKSLIKRFKNDPHGLLATLLAELVFANISLQDAKAIKQYLRAQVKELENKPTLQAEVDELLDNIAWYFENTETQPAPPPVRSAPVVLAAPLVPAKEGEATELIEPRNTLPVI